MVAKGFVIPISLLCIKSEVNAQRRPPIAEAEKTMMIPGTETAVTLKTMKKTPTLMKVMTPTRRRENFSSLNRKAKARTKMRADDLHIARI